MNSTYVAVATNWHIGLEWSMSLFPGVDYMLIDSQFSEQELMVRRTTRQFVDERVLPLIRECYRDGRFPAELIPEMGRLGFLGANLTGYGCAEMRMSNTGSSCRKSSAATPACAAL